MGRPSMRTQCSRISKRKKNGHHVWKIDFSLQLLRLPHLFSPSPVAGRNPASTPHNRRPQWKWPASSVAPSPRSFKWLACSSPYQEVEVHAKVAGYIRHINVDIGDRVRAGQALATLEIPEMDAELKGSDAEVRHSKDEITRAENQVAFAESQRAAVLTCVCSKPRKPSQE
jgi:biotin carboxyl carrier protein